MKRLAKWGAIALVALAVISGLTAPRNEHRKTAPRAATERSRHDTPRPRSFAQLARQALKHTEGDVMAARCSRTACALRYYLAPPDPSLYDRGDYPALANGELRPLWRALHRARWRKPTKVTVVTDIAPETGPIAQRITVFRVVCDPASYHSLAQGFGASVICD